MSKHQVVIIHPVTHAKLESVSDIDYLFQDGSRLPVYEGVPILLGSDSLFRFEDIIGHEKTTQDSRQMDTKNIKNFVRRKLLPSLSKDFSLEKRYEWLSNLLPSGGTILIIGVGEKSNYYKSKFSHCDVITSDVHNEFKPDYIFDGHNIPFDDNSFDMVLAAQVIEHTINPWIFSQELQRVTKTGGIIQIEAPSTFPFHAAPYDFFRFTYTGMRSLFPMCKVIDSSIPEGNASAVAVSLSNYLINLSSRRAIRMVFLMLARLLFGWLKYLDKLQPTLNRRTVSMPKGYAFTFQKDTIKRDPRELLNEYYQLPN